MAEFVYVDETGSSGRGANKQPQLVLVAAVVPEAKVASLGLRMREIAGHYLGDLSRDFEWHGYDLWNAKGAWEGRTPSELLEAFQAIVGLLEELDIWVAHATINKQKLDATHVVKVAYLMALQFLVEKVDNVPSAGGPVRVLIADEQKRHEIDARSMIASMRGNGTGIVGGLHGRRAVETIVDTVHFVDSAMSPGVQLADIIAFIHHRSRIGTQGHPNADVAVEKMIQKIWQATRTWREPWPAD